jgi:protein SCO1
MHDPSKRKLLSLAAMAPFAGGLLNSKAVSAAGTDAQAAARERVRQRYFPEMTLFTQDGKKVRFYDDLVKDKIVTINFFFSKCDEICPIVTANLVKVQELLGKKVGRDIFMNSITLKPEDDTPDVLAHFAEMHRAKPGWTFLTGKPDDIERLRRSLGFTTPDPRLDRDKNQHIGNIRYGNEPLMLWAACPGMASPDWIAESISWMIRPETSSAMAKR